MLRPMIFGEVTIGDDLKHKSLRGKYNFQNVISQICFHSSFVIYIKKQFINSTPEYRLVVWFKDLFYIDVIKGDL